jgi:hypothetical protein
VTWNDVRERRAVVSRIGAIVSWVAWAFIFCVALAAFGCGTDNGQPSSGDGGAFMEPDGGGNEQVDAGGGSVTDGSTPSNDAGGGNTDAGDSGDAAPVTFNVASAVSGGNRTIVVSFDAPPSAAAATTLANYNVPGLTLSGTPVLAANAVSIATSSQLTQQYTVTVSNVTRASDGQSLTVASRDFTGHPTFNVASATAVTARSVQVTFDSAPTPALATDATKYTIMGLNVTKATLAGSVVTLTTDLQAASAYTVSVTGVTRASDGDALVTSTADFTGRLPFDVMEAHSTGSTTVDLTFDAAPNAAKATTLANYAIAGLTLSGVPVLNGNIVSLKTSGQAAQPYKVTVSNVTRASDAEPLEVNAYTFGGTAVLAPTVTNVVVASTNPNNGTTPYNTGTTTVTITGTDLATVVCPMGVKLDDLDGAGLAVGTHPTACTVDSDTQITATFPAGIRTNATNGWNVIVTNMIASNTTSAVPFVPVAGLLVSEVYVGTTGNADHEYVEVYNPTSLPIDASAAGIGLKVHTRSSGGADTNKTLTFVTTGVIPSHGFLLVVSSLTDAGDAWYANRDATYSASLVGNGGVTISLSATADAKVIDRVGWGTQPAPGYEGTAATNVPSSQSIERLPAGGMGHATDTDVNSADFTAPSATLTPRGTADTPQP